MRKILSLASLAVAVLVAFAALSPPSHALLSGRTSGIFGKTCTITSAAAATGVHCLLDSEVPDVHAYVSSFIATVNGSTAWATTANCFLKDTAASPVTLATFAVAGLTANAVLGPTSANVTLAAPIKLGSGTTSGKGIDLVCNANGTGSDLVVTVFGVFKK